MKRHKNLTFRKPEYTILFRDNAFNKTNVIEPFDNYELALKSWEFIADRMYDVDGTGVSTFVQSPNIFLSLGRNRLDKLSQVDKKL